MTDRPDPKAVLLAAFERGLGKPLDMCVFAAAALYLAEVLIEGRSKPPRSKPSRKS